MYLLKQFENCIDYENKSHILDLSDSTLSSTEDRMEFE